MEPIHSPSHTRRAVRLLIVTFLAYGLLVATNEGEWWPFSIYPMFSQAGNSWSRTIVRAEEADLVRWDTLAFADLSGEPFSLVDHGVDPIDLANFVSKTRSWNESRVNALRKMFRIEQPDVPPLVVYRVNGHMIGEDSVALRFVPYAAMDAQKTLLNPAIPR